MHNLRGNRLRCARDTKLTAPRGVREIAWKAQCRLGARYRALGRKRQLKTVAITAVALEFAGFIWAISCEVTTARAAAR